MKYQLTLRCKNWRCDHHRKPYKRTVYVPEGESIDDQPDPPCPKCAKARVNDTKVQRVDSEEQAQPALPHMGLDLEKQTAPGIVGANAQVRAVDMTAEIVMQDYGMTDLKSNIRPGEAMAKPLPAPAQRAADNFFNPGGTNNKQRIAMKRLGQRAIQGAFRNTSLDMKTATSLAQRRIAGNTNIATYSGEPIGKPN